jgi:parallel beta-helix repeat protein
MSLFNFASLLKRIFPARSTRDQRRRSRYRTALQVVHLEDRLVPAVVDITPGHTGTFATIQAAVNAAFAGDTLLADPGTYAEHVTINKALTLEGAQQGVDARTRRGAESVVDGGGYAPFYITASDVTIDGFTVQGASNGSAFPGGFGIEMAPGVSGAHVTNNIIQDNIAGIALANLSGADQAVIQFNLFRNNTLPGSAGGNDIYADQYTAGAGGVNNVLIDDNTFTNTSFVEDAWALDVSNTGATPFSDITFSNNNVTDHGRGVCFYDTTNGTVTGNTITGASHYAIGLFGNDVLPPTPPTPPNSSFTIANNTLVADGAGLKLVNGASASAYSGTLTVADAVGANVSATAGGVFTGVVATFTDPTGTQAAGDYSATITWGDQDAGGNPLTSQGTVVDLGGGHFQVVGSHTYAEEGNYALSVSITGAGSSTTSTGMALGTASWSPDRYAPAGFTPGQTGGGRDGVLDEFISAGDQTSSRPAPYNTGFYDFQGRAYGLAAGTTYLAVDLYVPASWSGLTQKDPNGNPAHWGSLASLWATAVDASGNILSYPILGFNNQAGSGTGGFEVYTDANGWTKVAGFTGADRWYQLGIGIRAGQIDYFVNGQLVYTDTTATGTTALSNMMLQGYNGGNDYHILWDNLSDARATVAGAALSAGQLTPPGAPAGVSTGDMVLAREQRTFTVPGTPNEVVLVQFRLLARQASSRNEVGVFLVDDAQGRIAGMLPGNPHYLRRAVRLGRWREIFPRGQQVGSTLEMPLNGGARLMFCVVPRGGLRTALRRNPHNRPGGAPVVLFADGRRNPDRVNHERTSPLPNGAVLGWEDRLGGGDHDFNDVVYSVQLVRRQA